jgi:hypothetical protein
MVSPETPITTGEEVRALRPCRGGEYWIVDPEQRMIEFMRARPCICPLGVIHTGEKALLKFWRNFVAVDEVVP